MKYFDKMSKKQIRDLLSTLFVIVVMLILTTLGVAAAKYQAERAAQDAGNKAKQAAVCLDPTTNMDGKVIGCWDGR